MYATHNVLPARVLTLLAVWILVLSIAGIQTQPAFASSTLHVNNTDPSCNDTTGTPYCTIQAAMDAANSGDMINVAAGTYYEANININKSVTITGDPGDTNAGSGSSAPVIDGGSAPGDAFLIGNGVSNVTIQGFEIRNFASNDTGIGNGISAWEANTSNITIQDNYFHDLGWNGVLVGNDGALGDHTNWVIKNNIVEDYVAYGLELTNASNSSFENNVIHSSNSWTSILVVARRNESGITIKNNLIDGSIDDTEAGNGRAAIYILGWDIETAGAQLDSVIVENNQISTTGTKPHIRIGEVDSARVTNVTVTGNSLLTLENFAAAQVDATANWWGDLDPSDNITGTGPVDYSPWWGENYVGDSHAAPWSWYTNDSIQAAIDLASAGDNIHVTAGTYVEQVTVDKSLRLVGESGANSTFIKAPSTIPIASDPNSVIVKIAGVGVSVDLSGFTVTGPGPGGCGTINMGIFIRDGAYANIHDNKILDIRDNPFSGCQNGVAIFVGRASLNTNGTADIKNNVIAGYQKNGITVSGEGSNATIDGNTITGVGPTTIIAQNGIQISNGATAEIIGNTISGHSYTPFSYVSTGMLIMGAGVTNTSSNSVSENQVGIYVIDTAGSHDGNTISVSSPGTGSPGFWGIIVDSPPPSHRPSPLEDVKTTDPKTKSLSLNSAAPDQVVSVTNNVLTGDGTSAGIGLEADSGFGSFDIDLTATNNFIQNWGVGVEIYECSSNCTGTDFASLKVNLNSITDNLAGYNHTNPLFTADGEKNWWGSATGPAGAGPGSGDSVSSNVDFAPWLCDGTDTSPAIGFQPNSSSLCSVATKLIFSTQPGNGVAGSPLSTQPAIKAVDDDDYPDPNFSGAVTLTINNNPGGGTLGGTTTINAVSGVATFTNISISKAGTGYTLDANSTGLITATSSPFNIVSAGPAPAACLIYGVDELSKGSKFFTVDPITHASTPLGTAHYADIQGIDTDPVSGLLYAAAGSGNRYHKHGYLFIVDGITGALTPVGSTGQKSITALSFRPGDGVRSVELWGWASGKGLIKIDTSTGASTRVFKSSKRVGGITWNNDGTLLYIAAGHTLYRYDPFTNKLKQIANNLPNYTTALDMRPDGLLVVGSERSKYLQAYNVVKRKLIKEEKINVWPYNEIVGITWPVCSNP